MSRLFARQPNSLPQGDKPYGFRARADPAPPAGRGWKRSMIPARFTSTAGPHCPLS
nr:MAG TPA: hypothetical protein [Caudoviricetes sp.]DAW71167.1 MAG TPA: hypothetical protein [Caudoviricetes sp.]